MKTIGLRNHLRSNSHSEISELLLSLNIQSIRKLVPNFIIPFRYSQLVDGSLLKILQTPTRGVAHDIELCMV